MLPYTALHIMLFDFAKEPAFIMTSANPPNEPIIVENQEAIDKLKDVVDYFLFHDRDIAQRCDDSVARVIEGKQCFIRRSRGYAPTPVQLKKAFKSCVLGTGGELNVTSCILLKDRAFISQHIGDVEKLETLKFFKSATQHLMDLINCKVEAVACDLNPKFNTTRYARELGNEIPFFAIQHHHAHIASVMGELGIEEMIGIACDGIGYGSDGNIWGGEILLCNASGYERLAHLQEQPMVGGDLATIYPLRMAAGVLHGEVEIEEWLLAKKEFFPRGEREIEIILKQLERGTYIKTTSCGRVLDAVAALLGVCYERTYEGEPAMKLEAIAIRGRDVLNLQPEIKGDVLNTAVLLREVFNSLGKRRIADLACSAQSYLASGLAQLAVEKAEELGIEAIGFSGGVAYNEFITGKIKTMVERAGLNFYTNVQVPPGDGGISLGQGYAAALQLER
jgi:hydrogenase maturation protein HypF